MDSKLNKDGEKQFENYVNQKATIAYNEETGNVVVIG